MKKILIIAAVAAITASASAQFKLTIPGSKISTEFVREAVLPAVRVVKTTYFVTDSAFSQNYAYKTDSVFGTDFSLGIVTEQGLIVPEKSVCPWKTDERYAPYLNNIQYQPVLHMRTVAVPAAEPQYEVFEQTLGSLATALNSDSALFVLTTDEERRMTAPSFTIVNEETKGLMVWFMLSSKVDITQSANFDIKVSNATIEFTDAPKADAPEDVASGGALLGSSSSAIFGGVFVVPVVTGPGKVDFQIAGILAADADSKGKWVLYKPIMPQVGDTPTDEDEQPAPQPEPKDSDLDNLTPIDNEGDI